MDHYSCSSTQANQFTCNAWQPDWAIDGAISEGYPRFGTKDLGNKAGVLQLSSSTAAEFDRVLLKEAATFAASCTVLAIVANMF